MRPHLSRRDGANALAQVLQFQHSAPAPYWRCPTPPTIQMRPEERLSAFDAVCPPVLLQREGYLACAYFESGLLVVELEAEPRGDGEPVDMRKAA